MVNTSKCEVVTGSRSTTSLQCRLPQGCGTMPLTMYSPLQKSTNTLLVTYQGPSVREVVTPMGRSIEGSFPVTVHGEVRWCEGMWWGVQGSAGGVI